MTITKSPLTAVQIIVDSASDIGQEEVKALDFIVLPMTVSIGEEDFQDGVALNPCRILQKAYLGHDKAQNQPEPTFLLASSSILPSDAPICILGGTIGTHVGPGAFGIAFFEK